jgi:uncharacterized membrane protein (DUF373 family)
MGCRSFPDLSSLSEPNQKAMVDQDGLRRRIFRETADAWPSLGLYGRFEQAVSIVLTFLISCVIVVAIGHLVWGVARDLFFRHLAPVDHAVFQEIFGMIMTVLIALEFNHTILSILHRKESIVQLRTVILIALLAMARKFIIMDVTAVEPLVVIGLAFAVLALGCVYWLVRDQDRRQDDETDSTPAE